MPTKFAAKKMESDSDSDKDSEEDLEEDFTIFEDLATKEKIALCNGLADDQLRTKVLQILS